jgi:hypothetical protein
VIQGATFLAQQLESTAELIFEKSLRKWQNLVLYWSNISQFESSSGKLRNDTVQK